MKLGPAFTKLTEEDPSLTVVHNAENHEVVIWGQGEMHLRVASERLADRFLVPVSTRPPRSAIAKPFASRLLSGEGTRNNRVGTGSSVTWSWKSSRCRADRVSNSKPRITGGVVPRNYIPAVEEGSPTPSSTVRLVFR